jgi:SAM-dependent methyltransferase
MNPTPPIDDGIQFSAPLALRWSQTHCHEFCRAYHGLWSYLRVLGLGQALSGHPMDYAQAVRLAAIEWAAVDPKAPKRILICGSVDQAMQAHVRLGLGNCVNSVEIVALDLCATSIKINEWYAEKNGFPITCIVGDILNFQAQPAFDLIVTSSFLGFFSDEQRPAFFKKIHSLLMPHGQFIFSNRLRPDLREDRVNIGAKGQDDLANAIVTRLPSLNPEQPLDAATATSLAHEYASSRKPYPLRSIQDLRQWAEGAGLVCSNHYIIGSNKIVENLEIPTVSSGSDYVFATMTRPADKSILSD